MWKDADSQALSAFVVEAVNAGSGRGYALQNKRHGERVLSFTVLLAWLRICSHIDCMPFDVGQQRYGEQTPREGSSDEADSWWSK